jgi:uncharacterized protein with FMN-binding domain
MRRVIVTLGGTVAGLAALFSFKTHSLAGVSAIDTPTTPTAPAAAPPTTPPPTTPSTSTAGSSAKPTASSPTMSSGTGTTPPGSAAGTKTSMGTPTPTPTPTPTATRTVTGTVASTQYGPMQVQVTLAGTRITMVTVLQRTDDGAMSNEVDSFATPQLTAETLTAQSARIDAVSGASYTSSGYIQSLQSALDQADL